MQLLEMKKEIALLSQNLIDVYILNGAKPFDRSADPDLVNKRAELLSVIKNKVERYVSAGGIVFNHTFDLATDDQVESGAWIEFINEVTDLFDSNDLIGNYTAFTFNDGKGLKSVFFDEKCLDILKAKMQGKAGYGKIRLLKIDHEAPVFKEFGLPYLAYMNEYGLMALRLQTEVFLSK